MRAITSTSVVTQQPFASDLTSAYSRRAAHASLNHDSCISDSWYYCDDIANCG
jgi:hypothetical protein